MARTRLFGVHHTHEQQRASQRKSSAGKPKSHHEFSQRATVFFVLRDLFVGSWDTGTGKRVRKRTAID